MAIPQTIRAGDFIQWNIPASQDYYGNSISSPDWAVVYYLRTNTGPVGATVNSSAYNDGFKFTIASNVTATFTSGNWYYQAVANKSGAEKQTIYTGSFEVLKSLEYSGTALNYDGRSQVEKDLEVIQTAIRTIIIASKIEIILILFLTKKFLTLSFLVLLFIIEISSSIIKSYFLIRIEVCPHFYSILIHF